MRILITGPECTGKTTLAKELSTQLQIPWFPEYGRTYLEKYGPAYNQKDLLAIAKEYDKLVSLVPLDKGLILDTFLVNIKLWSELKFGITEPWIDQRLKKLKAFDQVFLMYPDLPWEQDGLRENQENLEEHYLQFIKILNQLGWQYDIISGQGEARLNAVLACLKKDKL